MRTSARGSCRPNSASTSKKNNAYKVRINIRTFLLFARGLLEQTDYSSGVIFKRLSLLSHHNLHFTSKKDGKNVIGCDAEAKPPEFTPKSGKSGVDIPGKSLQSHHPALFQLFWLLNEAKWCDYRLILLITTPVTTPRFLKEGIHIKSPGFALGTRTLFTV